MIINLVLVHLSLFHLMAQSRHSWRFTKWSKIIAYLEITDYHELIPMLSAVASSKDVIEAEVMFKGVLSDRVEDIKRNESDKVNAIDDDRFR